MVRVAGCMKMFLLVGVLLSDDKFYCHFQREMNDIFIPVLALRERLS